MLSWISWWSPSLAISGLRGLLVVVIFVAVVLVLVVVVVVLLAPAVVVVLVVDRRGRHAAPSLFGDLRCHNGTRSFGFGVELTAFGSRLMLTILMKVRAKVVKP